MIIGKGRWRRAEGLGWLLSKRLWLPVFLLASTILGEASTMSRALTKFDFEYFESLKSNQEAAALNYLNEEFPKGSSATAAVDAVKAAGAKCKFIHTMLQGKPAWFHWCNYVRPGHGLMFFVSSVEWKVAIYTGPDGDKIENIEVGRGATGL